MQLRNLNGLLSITNLAPLLYAEPIGALPDLRKRGKIEPPEEIMHQLDAVAVAHQYQQSTRREARATVRKAWTEAAKTGANVKISTLEELLSAAVSLDLDHPTHRKVARLLKITNTMREAA